MFFGAVQVALQVNKVTSTKTQIPYEYYDIPFCRPSKRRGEMENLGEVLAGDAITNSPYQVCAHCQQHALDMGLMRL